MKPMLLLFLPLVLCGCATDQLAKKLSWSKTDKISSSKFEQPTRMVVLWSPTVLTQPGQPATRGFGGRIYFYNEKSQAIPVEGQLVVYAYNDSRLAGLGQPNAKGGHTEPDRKFAFTNEQFATHFSPTELGPSYSVWIPWDALGGAQVELSLVPVFTTPNGQIVMGQSSRNLLKGNPSLPEVPAASTPTTQTVQPVGYNAPLPAGTQDAMFPTAGQGTNQRHVHTTTIALTPSLVKNLRENEIVPPAAQTLPLPVPEVQNTPVVSSTTTASSPATNSAAPNSVWSPPDPRSNHFVRPRHPVLTSPRPQPSASPAPWERDLRAPPSAPALPLESPQTSPGLGASSSGLPVGS